MKATVYNADYLFEQDSMDFDFPVEIHVNRFHNNDRITSPSYGGDSSFDNPDAYKVYINITEPVTSGNRELIEVVIKNSKYYDLILTTDKEILEKCENAVMFLYGSTWLNKGKIDHSDGLGEYDESLDLLCENKRFEISFLCSNHQKYLEGYNKRKELWSERYNITVPTLFYSSTRYPMVNDVFDIIKYSKMNFRNGKGYSDIDFMLPEDDKKYLFNSQFHIAIESTSTINYFTEKLIDALITKTVPIYWGCPNIGDFFDTRGIISIHDTNLNPNISETSLHKSNALSRLKTPSANAISKEYKDALKEGATTAMKIVEVLNTITTETYEQMLPFIEENYERAKEFARPLSDRVKETIIKEKRKVLK